MTGCVGPNGAGRWIQPRQSAAGAFPRGRREKGRGTSRLFSALFRLGFVQREVIFALGTKVGVWLKGRNLVAGNSQGPVRVRMELLSRNKGPVEVGRGTCGQVIPFMR